MKQLEAVIRRDKFPAVDAALKKAGVGGLTITEAMGRGRSAATIKSHARGEWTYTTEFLRHIIVNLVVEDGDVDRIVKIIVDNATTKSLGDGKIFVLPIEKAVDIGTGESDTDAVLDIKQRT